MEEKIYNEILKTNTYRFLDSNLIKRIISEESNKYKKYKDQLHAVKTRLHIIYGSFISNKSYSQALQILNENLPIEEIYPLHSSTSERMDIYEEMYEFIFSVIKDCSSVIDLGCGFNPFSFKYQHGINKYYAYDLDKRNIDLLNIFFDKEKINGQAQMMDLITDVPDIEADIAYMFKLVPVIEGQKKGRTLEIIEALNVKYLIITYPLKSLTGKNKNMEYNYQNSFYNSIGSKYKVLKTINFKNEMLYIIEKG